MQSIYKDGKGVDDEQRVGRPSSSETSNSVDGIKASPDSGR